MNPIRSYALSKAQSYPSGALLILSPLLSGTSTTRGFLTLPLVKIIPLHPPSLPPSEKEGGNEPLFDLLVT